MTATDLAVLDAARERLGPGATMTVVGSFAYSTSNLTTELEVAAGSNRFRLLLKELSAGSRLAVAARTRPGFVDDPGREPAVYRALAGSGITPACWGSSCRTEDRAWVLVEKADAQVLWQVPWGPAWTGAAAALARLHESPVHGRLGPDTRDRLLVHDARLHEQWARRAVDACSDRRDRRAVRHLIRVADSSDAWSGLPAVLLHGEAYPSNILVGRADRILLVDWEMAGYGPGVVDLAALVCGWEEGAVQRLARAYWEALTDRRGYADQDHLMRALQLARLRTCIQWIGWSPGWEPPPENRQDWLAMGLAVAEEMTV